MSKFIATIKHAIVEDDPEPKSSPAKQAHPEASTSGPAASSRERVPVASQERAPYNSLGEETEHVYKKILAKTDFQATPVCECIHKYLDPLSAIPAMDERTKFKTAVVQARAREGLTHGKSLATFDGLKVSLQNEQESFAAAAEATQHHEVTSRKRKVRESTDAS